VIGVAREENFSSSARRRPSVIEPRGVQAYKWPMQRWLMIGVWGLTACGGSSKGADDPSTAATIADSPGIQCIDKAKIERQPPVDAPTHIDVAHIVVRHAGVRNAGDVIRTREEACLRAEEAREKLLASGDWDAVYDEYSDSKGAAEGVLYNVTQGSLDPAFAGVAFSLEVDALSHVVETSRGFHVIWRKK